jgi:hypothetical protein
MSVFTLHRGSVPLLVSMPHIGTEIPDRAARAATRRARSRSKTPTGTWTGSTTSLPRLGASVLRPRYSRYVIDLNRPPDDAPMYPGASNTELCPTRFFSGEPLYRRPRRPRRRARAAPRGLLAALPRGAGRRAGAAESAARPRAAVGRAQHPLAKSPGCSKASCPTSTSARPAAPARMRPSPPRWCRLRRAPHHHRRQRPLQGRLHHAPLRPAGRGRACRAAGDVPKPLHAGSAALRYDEALAAQVQPCCEKMVEARCWPRGRCMKS